MSPWFKDGIPTPSFWTRSAILLAVGAVLIAGAVLAFVNGSLGGILLLLLGLPLVGAGVVRIWIGARANRAKLPESRVGERGRSIRDAVVAAVLARFPSAEVEIPIAAHEGISGAYLTSPAPDEVDFELVVGENGSYTLFAGTTLIADGEPMTEPESNRVARIVRQISDVARTGIPEPTAGDLLRDPRLRAALPWSDASQ